MLIDVLHHDTFSAKYRKYHTRIRIYTLDRYNSNKARQSWNCSIIKIIKLLGPKPSSLPGRRTTIKRSLCFLIESKNCSQTNSPVAGVAATAKTQKTFTNEVNPVKSSCIGERRAPEEEALEGF